MTSSYKSKFLKRILIGSFENMFYIEFVPKTIKNLRWCAGFKLLKTKKKNIRFPTLRVLST